MSIECLSASTAAAGIAQINAISNLTGFGTTYLMGFIKDETGKSADFLVLNLRATPLIALRSERASSVEDLLAGLIFMGDDRVVKSRFIAGRHV